LLAHSLHNFSGGMNATTHYMHYIPTKTVALFWMATLTTATSI
jgi:hypothetical protein